MLRSAASKVMWVGRATVFLVGLAMILALLFGVATMALAAVPGDPLKLGKLNTINAMTRLAGTNSSVLLKITNNGSDSALGLEVEPGVPPMRVNSSKKVPNLNADKLDNTDSSAFASKTSEAWHEVGAAGQPPFNSVGGPLWQNSNDPRQFNTVGFYKDSLGTVHLKGVAQVASGRLIPAGSCGPPVFGPSAHVFVLPQGYRPARRAVFPATRSEVSSSRVDILSSGEVYICDGADLAQGQWVSLDAIEFRAAN